MKKLLLILLVLTSCSESKHRPYIVFTSYGSGWDRSSTRMFCDSVKLFDRNHARVYVDNAATDVYAEQILISNN